MGRRHRNKLARGANAPLVVNEPEPLISEFDRPIVASPAQLPARNSGVSVKTQMVAYSGPLPHPEIMRQYNEIVPGLADRLVVQFEEQGRHRRKIENRTVWHRIVSATAGQVMAFVLILTTIGVGGYLLYLDKPIGGLGAIITAIAGAVAVMIRASTTQSQNLKEKRDQEQRVLQKR